MTVNNDKKAHMILMTQRSISSMLFDWSLQGYELGTPYHDLFVKYTNRLAHLMAPELFVNEVWFGRLGHGNKIHACRGSHAMCGTASGRTSWGKSGLMSAHSEQESMKVSDVTCEKCAAKVAGMKVTTLSDKPTLAELVAAYQITVPVTPKEFPAAVVLTVVTTEEEPEMPESWLGYRAVSEINPDGELLDKAREALVGKVITPDQMAAAGIPAPEPEAEPLTVWNRRKGNVFHHETEAKAALEFLFAALTLELEHKPSLWMYVEGAINSAGQMMGMEPDEFYYEAMSVQGLLVNRERSRLARLEAREIYQWAVINQLKRRRNGEGIYTLMHNWTGDPQWADAPQFLFYADGSYQAQSKAQGWGRYHSLDRETVKARPATAEDMRRLELHNEWVK